MDSSTTLRKSLKKHTQGTRFGYGIDMKEKFKIYLAQPCLPGELCVCFNLGLSTFDLCSSANELQQNSNASFRKEYIPQILTVLILFLRVYI